MQALNLRQAMYLRQRESGIDLPAISKELSKWVAPLRPEPLPGEKHKETRSGRGNFGPNGVYFERGGTFIETLNGDGDIVSGDKNVYGGTP